MGVLEIAIGCVFVAVGLSRREFFGGAPGASRRRRYPLPVWEGRIVFVLGGAVSIAVGIHKIIHP
jgi:hypothetical protein